MSHRDGDAPFVQHHPPAQAEIVGVSPAIRRCTQQAEVVAASESTVLLSGETGTGKDLFARYIHARSPRSRRPFVVVDCAGLPETLLESELFGHERGAFTGADQRRVGRFEQARGGSILLDEIGELPLAAQTKLLRVLETAEFERLGSGETHHVDARIIAATNRNLAEAVSMGTFRKDLYFRLNVFPLELPPLRERPEDVSVLAYYFLAKMKRSRHRLDACSLELAEEYPWPGNARELRNVVERAALLSPGPLLQLDIPGCTWASMSPPPGDRRSDVRPLAEQLHDMKVRALREALRTTGGNRSRAAALLGIDPASFFRMAKRLGVWPMSRSETISTL